MLSRAWIYGLIVVLILILVVVGAKYANPSRKSKFTVADLSKACTNRVNLRSAWTEYVIWLHKYPLVNSDQIRQLLAQNVDKSAMKISTILSQIGGQNASQIAPLMREHAKIAIGVINKDPNALVKWKDNVNSLASLLSSLNPTYWRKEAILAMFQDRLGLLQKGATTFMGGGKPYMNLYSQILDQVYQVADTLSEGLAAAQARAG